MLLCVFLLLLTAFVCHLIKGLLTYLLRVLVKLLLQGVNWPWSKKAVNLYFYVHLQNELYRCLAESWTFTAFSGHRIIHKILRNTICNPKFNTDLGRSHIIYDQRRFIVYHLTTSRSTVLFHSVFYIDPIDSVQCGCENLLVHVELFFLCLMVNTWCCCLFA